MMPLNQMAGAATPMPASHSQAPTSYVPQAAQHSNISRPVSDATAGREIQNNTQGNPRTPLPSPPALSSPAPSVGEFFTLPAQSSFQGSSSTSPFFLAQLLGQGLDAEAQHIVINYEALAAARAPVRATPQTTKNPSNLQNVFQSILADENPAAVQLPAAPPPAAAASAVETSKHMAAIFPVTVNPTSKLTTTEEGEAPAPAKAGKSLGRPPKTLVSHQGFLAYFATAVRNVVQLDFAELPSVVA